MPDFKVTNITWLYRESRELSLHPTEPIKVGIKSAAVECQKCGEAWHATEGRRPGQFRVTLGAIVVTCPGCNHQASVEVPQ